MYRDVATGGRFWVSGRSPRWADWRGRQAYRYQMTGKKPDVVARPNLGQPDTH